MKYMFVTYVCCFFMVGDSIINEGRHVEGRYS